MDLLQKMNLTIKHIENNLTSQIDYNELAKYVMCSVYHYQRMFSFIAGVSLGEYIRRRRLTSAAFDLQNGEEQIIEIALKYGYESPESFSRAFKQLHGVTPTSARNGGVILKSFPPISFQISIKGAIEMNYRIESLDEFQVVGLTKKVNQTSILEKNKPYNEIMEMWNKVFEENLFDKLWDLKKEERPIKGILGVFSDGNWGNNDYFNYMLGIITESNIVESKYEKMIIPKSQWVVFEVEDAPENLFDIWKQLYTEWLPVSNYELAQIPAIENYLPVDENKNELWIPIIPKESK